MLPQVASARTHEGNKLVPYAPEANAQTLCNEFVTIQKTIRHRLSAPCEASAPISEAHGRFPREPQPDAERRCAPKSVRLAGGFGKTQPHDCASDLNKRRSCAEGAPWLERQMGAAGKNDATPHHRPSFTPRVP